MTGVDIELARVALVSGLVIAALLYQFTGLVSGGAVAGPYLALMALQGDWLDIGGWLVLSLVGVATIRILANTWPLPRAWLFAAGIIVPAAIHSLMAGIAGGGIFEQWTGFLMAGLYVTNGLTAYDAQRQGVARTLLGVAIVGAATVLVVLAVQWGQSTLGVEQSLQSAPTLQDPIIVFSCIIFALALRAGLKLGTAGIIGAVFFVELANVASIVVVVAMAIIGTLIYRLVERALGLTPRQRLYSLLAVGAIVSWFGLFWAQWLGIPGAEQAHLFAVEPLLVIGLMMGEMVRWGIPRMLAGSTMVFLVVLGVAFVVTTYPQWSLAALAVVMGLSALVFAHGAKAVRREWHEAIVGGSSYTGSLGQTTRKGRKSPQRTTKPS